ncbi:hypothetical protein B7494_g361 [Chlorociboria aeruginascens]|nr:hypothetical protein B7494_g361 [Chlorociboria aeruginascens]
MANKTKYLERSIPKISLASFDFRIAEVTAQLVEAAEKHGFFTIVDHGIPITAIQKMFSLSASFFNLSDDVKATVPFSTRNAGWEKNSQVRPSTGMPDRKESYQMQFGSNMNGLWLPDDALPGFRETSLQFMRAVQEVSERLMVCFARGLGFPDNYFVDFHDISRPDSQTVLRLLRYFRVDSNKEISDGYYRAGAHVDWDLLTLLFQKEGQSGLEICPGREASTDFGIGDKWTKIEPKEGEIVCNIGDLLMSWSDDRFKTRLSTFTTFHHPNPSIHINTNPPNSLLRRPSRRAFAHYTQRVLPNIEKNATSQSYLTLHETCPTRNDLEEGYPHLLVAGKVPENPGFMIWYLLYPFRGTTEPPILDQRHPLRNCFTQYGNRAGRHPVITLLISVATAVIFIYPFPFLYTNNFANGASNLPHHVWTSAQPFKGDGTSRADVAMRSIWVHGSYMKALEPNVLQTALRIQDDILGSTLNFDPRRPSNQIELDTDSTDLTVDMRNNLHAINGPSNSSWFFHSPLQYWSCSSEEIKNDADIISTVNRGSQLSTSVNVTLRHSIVFSGKRYEDYRLVAADALVITLIHRLDSPVGKQWERRAEALADKPYSGWRLYPANGRSLGSTLYEFQFQPLSFQDDLFLGVAYALTTLYFLASLSKLRALKSRVGLTLAVLTQFMVTIMSSFTICAIFKIDLSKIPREVYPLVVLTVGLENIFRLINGVIMTPSANPTSSRMAEAVGQTGHIALAGVTQNLAILWFLSKVVSPDVAAFCSFAAIALTLDFFYLFTFFVAVLSVDVRRTELSDSLSRASARKPEYIPKKASRNTFTDALLRGEIPVSTRIAGTIVMVVFIVIAQWHFFGNESVYQTIIRITRLKRPVRPSADSAALLSVDVNQARSPTSWLRLQDHETAHELIQIIKPEAHSYIARVYDPLVFVVDGSDRTPTQFGIRPLLPAAYDFAKHQSGPFVLVVLLLVAGVSLLMNYLLWDETTEDENNDRRNDEPLLSIKTLSRGHTLDVILLVSSPDGVLVSVGLDRRIRVWDIRPDGHSYVVEDLDSNINPYPVLTIAIDDDSNWLAILSSKGQVILWNIPERRWGPVMPVESKGRSPAAFFFGRDKTELIDPVVMVGHNGMLTELNMEANMARNIQVCKTPLTCVRPYAEKVTQSHIEPPLRIITTSKRGCVHVATQFDTGWISEDLKISCSDEDDTEVISISPLPVLGSFLAVRQHSVDLVDMRTHNITHTFKTKPMKPHTLQCFHSTRRRPQCGSVGLGSLTLAYTDLETGECILQNYLPRQDGDTICFRDPNTPGSKTCCLWRETVQETFTVQNPGEWEALQVGYVIGIRKVQNSPDKINTTAHARASSFLSSGLRRRGGTERSLAPARQTDNIIDAWEVWSMSSWGELSVTSLCDREDVTQGHLLVSQLGPLAKVGKSSVALGLGNVVKVVSVGHERFDAADGTGYGGQGTLGGMATRKKKADKKKSH